MCGRLHGPSRNVDTRSGAIDIYGILEERRGLISLVNIGRVIWQHKQRVRESARPRRDRASDQLTTPTLCPADLLVQKPWKDCDRKFHFKILSTFLWATFRLTVRDTPGNILSWVPKFALRPTIYDVSTFLLFCDNVSCGRAMVTYSRVQGLRVCVENITQKICNRLCNVRHVIHTYRMDFRPVTIVSFFSKIYLR